MRRIRDAISMLTVSECDRALGYIDALIENRTRNGQPAA